MIRYILVAAIMLSCTVSAQTDSLRAVVNVNNEYNPVHIKVNKKSFVPSISSDTRKKAPEYRFTSDAIPYNGFVSENSNAGLPEKQECPYNGYARAGYGTGNWLDLKAAYRYDLTARDNIRFAASMDGFMTEIDGIFQNWDSRMYNSCIDLGYTHVFNNLRIDVAGEFNNRLFNYQKSGLLQTVTDKQNSMDYGVHVKGASLLTGAFGYNFNAAFTHNNRKYSTGLDNSIYENCINAGGHIWYSIDHDDIKKVGLRVNLDAFLYNNTLRDAMHPYDNYYSVDIDPFIDFNFGGWEMHLGTRMNLITEGEAAFAIAPEIRIEKYFNGNISLFAEATGGRTDNNFARLGSITPYWNFDEDRSTPLKPTYKVVDAVIGTTMTFEPFSLGITAGYAYTKDDLMQYDTTGDRYSVYDYVYSNFGQDDTHNAHASLNMGYDFGGWLRIAGDARYDYWKCDSEELLVMRPEVTCNLNAEVKPLRGLTVSAAYNFTYFAKGADDKRIDSKNELNARASYNIFPWLGVYLQGENLLGDSYFEYAGYETRGARGMLGVTANF